VFQEIGNSSPYEKILFPRLYGGMASSEVYLFLTFLHGIVLSRPGAVHSLPLKKVFLIVTFLGLFSDVLFSLIIEPVSFQKENRGMLPPPLARRFGREVLSSSFLLLRGRNDLLA